MLADIWPSADEIADAIGGAVTPELFRSHVRQRLRGRRALARPARARGDRYAWDAASTYIAAPPFFSGLTPEPGADHATSCGARVLAVLGDSVTTDHISPAGNIAAWSPAGQWLQAQRREPRRLQQLRRPARPPRGHDAGHLRQHPPAQRAGLEGGPLDDLPARRRGALHLRRRHALPGGRHAAAHPGGQGVRQRQLAATGPPRAPGCWASGPCSPSRSSASTAPTWWAWASCRCSSCPARTPPAWASTAARRIDILGLSDAIAPRSTSDRDGTRRRRATAAFEAVVPAGRCHRGRLLPPRRHPAGRAAAPGRGVARRAMPQAGARVRGRRPDHRAPLRERRWPPAGCGHRP